MWISSGKQIVLTMLVLIVPAVPSRAQVASTPGDQRSSSRFQKNTVSLEVTSGSHRLRTHGVLIGNAAHVFAAVPQGTAVNGVRSVDEGFVVETFLQKGSLLVIRVGLRRRESLASLPAARPWSVGSSSSLKPSRVMLGSSVFLDLPKGRVKGTVAVVSRICSSRLMPVFVIGSKLPLGPEGFVVHDGGSILGFRLHEIELDNGTYHQVVVHASSMKQAAQTIERLYRRLIYGVDPSHRTSTDIRLDLEGRVHTAKAHAVMSPDTLFAIVPSGQRVREVHGLSYVSSFHQAGDLVAIKSCNLENRSKLMALPTVPSSKTTESRKAVHGKRVFYFVGNGFWETQVVGPWAASDASIRTFKVSSIRGVDSSFGALSSDSLPVVDDSGLMVGLRSKVRLASAKDHVHQVDVVLSIRMLEDMREVLNKKDADHKKASFALMQKWHKKLETRIKGSLVTVRTQKPHGTYLGFLVRPNVVVVQSFYTKPDTRILVQRRDGGDENPVKVEKVRPGHPILLLRLERPLKGSFPVDIEYPPGKSCKKNGQWEYLLAAGPDNQRIELLPFARMGSKNLLPVLGGGSFEGLSTIDAMPVFRLCSGRPVYNGLSKSIKLDLDQDRSGCTISPGGWKMMALKGHLHVDEAYSARDLGYMATRGPFIRISEIQRRPRRSTRRSDSQVRFRMMMQFHTGSTMLAEQKDSSGQVTAQDETDVPFGVRLVPRMRVRLIRHISLFGSRKKGLGKFFEFMGCLPFVNGYQVFLDFPMSVDYMVPFRRDDRKSWRFRGGMALSLESVPLFGKLILPTMLNLLLPEVGFTAIHVKGEDPVWGIYFGMVRLPITYLISESIGVRFSFSLNFGYRFPKNEEGKYKARDETSFQTSIGVYF